MEVVAVIVGIIYLICLFTIGILTFKKGYTLLGLLGAVMPILWLIGAFLPARPGSWYAVNKEDR
jgi:hypothetical protein